MRKKEILPFETWMDLEGIIISEITQIQKDKNCMVPCTCEILKKKKRSQTRSNKLLCILCVSVGKLLGYISVLVIFLFALRSICLLSPASLCISGS